MSRKVLTFSLYYIRLLKETPHDPNTKLAWQLQQQQQQTTPAKKKKNNNNKQQQRRRRTVAEADPDSFGGELRLDHSTLMAASIAQWGGAILSSRLLMDDDAISSPEIMESDMSSAAFNLFTYSVSSSTWQKDQFVLVLVRLLLGSMKMFSDADFTCTLSPLKPLATG